MENSLIEQFDKARYNMNKWLTIGWAVWDGSYILKDLIINRLIILVLVFIGLIGWILFSIHLIKLLRLSKKINANHKLKEALTNEMIRFNSYKSFCIGFWTFLVTIVCFLVVSVFYDLSALLVCRITLYLGVLSFFTAWLIYNRK